MKARTANFTFLELMVVIAIMAIMSAVAAPQLAGFYENTKLQSAARQLSAFLNYSREKAIMDRRVCQVVLDSAGNGVKLMVQKDPIRNPRDFELAEGRLATWEPPLGITLACDQGGSSISDPNAADKETVFTLENTAGEKIRVKVLAGSGRASILND